jgi:alcohol dehydrogenase class IV
MSSIQFEFATATRILFGPGRIEDVGPLAASLGRRALVVAGRTSSRVQRLSSLLQAKGVEIIPFPVGSEPTTELVREGVELARRRACDVVIGFGGGSCLDAGKAIAALAANEGDVYDYLEVIGKGKSLTRQSIPYIAIPTTAGTGTEVSRNAVLGAPEFGVKVSLRSPYMLARLAIIDPTLTYSLPPGITASTGLDALTQLIEPFVCISPNPLTDAITREGMKRAARSLVQAYYHGDDGAARVDMAIAALFSGLALANAKLGGVHGFAGVLGGHLNAPHGAICARLLPDVMSVNVRALTERDPQSETLQRYDEVAQILTGSSAARAVDGIRWVADVCNNLKIPRLAAYGLNKEDFPVIIEKSARASSMKGNPIALTLEEMDEVLERAL